MVGVPAAHAGRVAVIEGEQPADDQRAHLAPITELLERFGVPGVSVAVIDDFEVAWAKSWGVADAESGVAATDGTLYQAASISKPVAAVASLQAVQDGLFTLDQGINTILTSWTLPDGPFGGGLDVTPRMLMSHTAGLGDGFGFPGYEPGEPLPTVPQILDGQAPSPLPAVRLVRPALAACQYSGGGVLIQQQALTDVVGTPFAQLMRERVLEPIGMVDSTFEQPLPGHLSHRAARAHDSDGAVMGVRSHVYPEQAAAGLWTTATDLARFLVDVQRTLAGRSSVVLHRSTAREMMTPVGVGPFGVGFMVSRQGAGWYLEHDGANWGFQAQVIAHVAKGYGAAIMTNSDSGARLISELQARIATAYAWDLIDEPLLG